MRTIDVFSLHNWRIMVWTFLSNNDLISNIAPPQIYQAVLLITSKGLFIVQLSDILGFCSVKLHHLSSRHKPGAYPIIGQAQLL